jgi:Rrf2 family transcriptional regulator, nitric oxide-sensitive transcriptional repressor
MRFTAFTDYSLRVLIYLACAPEGRGNIADIARAFGVSEHHLVKVVHLLGREGVLATTRGRGGGIRLACSARAIRVGDVVRATGGENPPAQCFDPAARECAITPVCRLKGVLARAVDAFHEVLDGTTLDELVASRAPLQAILHRAAPLQ